MCYGFAVVFALRSSVMGVDVSVEETLNVRDTTVVQSSEGSAAQRKERRGHGDCAGYIYGA